RADSQYSWVSRRRGSPEISRGHPLFGLGPSIPDRTSPANSLRSAPGPGVDLERQQSLRPLGFTMTRHSARGRSGLRLEPLDSREVPATLVNASTLTYQDVDGDTVRVSFSKAILTPGNVNTVFIFDTGTADSGNSTGQQLRRIDLTGLGATATGVGITTTAARSSATGGDGFAAVGQINATGIDLGAVTIDGDL